MIFALIALGGFVVGCGCTAMAFLIGMMHAAPPPCPVWLPPLDNGEWRANPLDGTRLWRNS